MKTFLSYLTFAALLTLCYIEKMNAEAAKSRARATSDSALVHTSIWVKQPAVARLSE